MIGSSGRLFRSHLRRKEKRQKTNESGFLQSVSIKEAALFFFTLSSVFPFVIIINLIRLHLG